MAFKVAYALGMISVGRLIDKIGTKMGYALSTFVWSLAAIGHALANSTLGFIARAALGISEAGNFPAAIKTTSEWFPKKERAFATGIFNSGCEYRSNCSAAHCAVYCSEDGLAMGLYTYRSIGFIWVILWFYL